MGPRQVLQVYRLRWQLELVFKRAKSIMGLGQLPKYSDASSQAWLNGKLLVAMLVEKLWQHAEHFSPWGYDLPESA
jgi:IS4 transposase